ncbi:MAG: type II secretion system F family protein [Bacilli bacterium]|jgi:type IV pilus assembly protein PilC
MNLWSLLLPFKWIIVGIGVVFNGIFVLLRKIGYLLGSLFVYLYKAVIAIGKVIIFISKILLRVCVLLIKKIGLLFMILLRSLKSIILGIFIVVRFIVLYSFDGLIAIFKWLFNVIKKIILGLYKVFYYIFKYLFIALKYIAVNIYKGLYFMLKYLYLGIYGVFKYLLIVLKYVLVNTYKGLRYMIKYILLGIKYFFIYLYRGMYYAFKYLIISIKYIAIYLYKGFYYLFKYLFIMVKFIAVNVIYKYLGSIIRLVAKYFMVLIKYIGIIFVAIWNGLKIAAMGIYKVITYPFVYLYKNIGPFFSRTFKEIKYTLKSFLAFIPTIPNKIKNRAVNWYNNLSVVKNAINKREMKRQALLIDFEAAEAERSEKKISYRYLAKATTGKMERGFLSAYSKLDVHSYLLTEGYEVYEIEPAKGLSMRIGGGISKIGISDLVFFLTQLSTYIKSGIPLVDSIKILGKQTRKSNIKTLYKSLIYDLIMGDSFSEALGKQETAFPRLLVNMVKSSELAGNLSETLDDMADYYSTVSQTKKQMKAALAYPTVILIFAFSVVVFIMIYVIPTFVDMYKDAEAEMPALTMAIINLSAFLVHNIVWLLGGLLALVVGIYFMYKNIKIFRLIVQWISMHVPVLGKIIIYNEVTMFSKTFASLWNHNVFITSSMEILSKITDNEIYKMLIFDAITNVARGDPVSKAFKDNWAFPVVAYEMLVTGERTGQPGPMMDKVASFYQEEHKNAVNQIKSFIEPALIIFLAVVVGVILLSVVLPMFSIYGELGLKTT